MGKAHACFEGNPLDLPTRGFILFSYRRAVGVVDIARLEANSCQPILVFVLTFLTVYDWLTLTNRLYNRACVILALGVAVAFTRWIAQREVASLAFWKKSTPWLVALFLLTFLAIHVGKWADERIAVGKLLPAPRSTPNVLVIVLDTLRADHLSSYGYARKTSPEMDRIASQRSAV